ncbi:MAG: site-specific integrase, partial [Ktedonobacteraceae bacterium]|nr:site-specific integrase [Ktedonobacteraceae bacterium]
RSMKTVLQKGLEHAVHERLLSVNPCKGASLPRVEKRKPPLLTLEQAHHLLQVVQGTMMEPFIALALLLGMRHGELLVLRWEDIDFASGTMYIHRSLTRAEDHHFVEGNPKTEAGERTILLPQPVSDILKAHRTRQHAQRLRAGSAWQNHDLVFCTHRGKRLWPQNMRTSFYRRLEKAGLPPMHIHDLRHNAVTLLISMGVNPKVVQEMVGHSQIAVTMEVYSHVLPSMQKEAAEKIENLFERPS